MNERNTFEMIITYTDGSRQRFRFPPQVDALKMNHLVERLLTTPTLSLQLRDRLIVFPTATIRSAEVLPVPEKLPEVVLRDVEWLSDVE
jgi:hypothetical protein